MTSTSESRVSPAREAQLAPQSGPDATAAWWPVALSREVTGCGPTALRLGDQQLAVYRDGGGRPRAVEDRCAHRRIPLSQGQMTSDGNLQCTYHGWCFDGSDGSCVRIPNFRPDEAPPSRIRVRAFPAQDVEGLLFVWSSPDAPRGEIPEPPGVPQQGASWSATTTTEVRAPWGRVAAALASNLADTVGQRWLIPGGPDARTPKVEAEDGSLVVERDREFSGRWRLPTYGSITERFHHRPGSIVTRIDLSTGFTTFRADLPVGEGEVRGAVGLTPHGSYRTRLHLAVEIDGSSDRLRPVLEAGARLAFLHSRLVARSAERAADDVTGGGADPAASIVLRALANRAVTS